MGWIGRITLVSVALAGVALSQTEAKSESALIRDLADKVSRLESQLADLQARLDGRPAQAPLVVPLVVVPRVESAVRAQPEAAAPEPQNGAGSTSPEISFRGFGDVGYQRASAAGRGTTLPGTASQGFGVGQIDLFVTSRLSSRFGVLLETVVESNQNNEISIDIERAQLQYRHNDYLNVDVGRYHTAIGYYNTAFHHGRWFQTTVGRPFMFAFEDEGGMLPLHNVGVTASGKVPSGALGLRYIVEIGNGRAYRRAESGPVQNRLDENNGKAINFALSARPPGVPGLQMGGSLYRDRLTPDGAPAVQQQILSGYLVYLNNRVELLHEVIWMRHLREAGGARIRSSVPGFYSQAGYRLGGGWRPYVRFEQTKSSGFDPIAGPVLGANGSRRSGTIGLRFDMSDFAAIKFQYERVSRSQLGWSNQIAANLAFTF